jgi:hypothetical protein
MASQTKGKNSTVFLIKIPSNCVNYSTKQAGISCSSLFIKCYKRDCSKSYDESMYVCGLRPGP